MCASMVSLITGDASDANEFKAYKQVLLIVLKAYLSWLNDGVLVEVAGIAQSLVHTKVASSLYTL